MTNPTHRLLLIEDVEEMQEIVKEGFSFFQDEYRIVNTVSNVVDAERYIRRHRKRLYGIVSDLRILAGPNQGFHPPIDTLRPMALSVFQMMEESNINDVPVVGYSRFLGPGTATKIAAENAKAEHDFVIAVINVETMPRRFAETIIRAFRKYYYEKLISSP